MRRTMLFRLKANLFRNFPFSFFVGYTVLATKKQCIAKLSLCILVIVQY